jgi:tetratricopeptide (TPR) repeat protein
VAKTTPFSSMKINSPSYHFFLGLGEMYFKSGQIQRALNIYKHALSLYPNDAKFHNNLANCYLLLGQFSKGWLEYEWRLRVTEFAPMKFAPIPFWNGESLSNKTIAIMPEQGLGDAIQFVRYVSLARKRRKGNFRLSKTAL